VRLALIGCVAAAALLAAGHFRNFGGFLSIWDWLFGTAYCPSNREVPALASPASNRRRIAAIT